MIKYITVTNLKPNEYGKSISVTAAGLTLSDASVYGYDDKTKR